MGASGIFSRLSLNTWRVIILLTGAFLFLPFLGQVHLFDWDEINFAECAREMITSDDYLNVQIDYSPFWEKPPLFIWMQVASMKIFGINEYAARFPNAVCGIISLLFIFEAGRKLYNIRFGLFWTLMYVASLLPFFYFKSGIIDPWFNLFIFASVYYLTKYFQETKLLYAILPAIAAGLAVLTKGPAAVLIIGLAFLVFLIIKKFRVNFKGWHIPFFILVFIITGGAWFLMQMASGNTSVMMDFINYQVRLFTTEDAGHGGFLLYHFVIVFLGAAPASVLAIPSLFNGDICHDKTQRDFRIWMVILFWVVMILFTIVKTKIVHYSSLSYFPLTFLAALTLNRLYENKMLISGWKKVTMLVIFAVLTIVIALIPFFDSLKYYIFKSGMVKDDFAIANMLADGKWTFFITIICIASLIAMLSVLYFVKISSVIRLTLALSFIYVFFNFSVMFLVTPSVEKYSQNAAIEFFKSKQYENAYVYPVGYKSYAHLFYTYKPYNKRDMKWNEDEFLKGNADKHVYVVLKVNRAKQYFEQYPLLEVLYSKNGFVFAVVVKEL